MVVRIDINIAMGHNARMIQNFFDHNPLNRLPHPPYSPERSASDFYLPSFRESEERADWTRDF
jgi:hypothetical protein